MTGREALGPKLVELTPGMPLRVSPNVLSRLSDSSRPFNMVTGTISWSASKPNGLPVTATEGNSIRVVSSAKLKGLVNPDIISKNNRLKISLGHNNPCGLGSDLFMKVSQSNGELAKKLPKIAHKLC